QRLHSGYDCQRTSDPPTRTVEGGHKAVASSVGFTPTITVQVLAHGSIVTRQSGLPRTVAQRTQDLGRVGDINEKNGGQHPIVHLDWTHASDKSFDLCEDLFR